MQELIERLKGIKAEQETLSLEQSEIIAQLGDMFCYQNSDGTWTRFTKIDNIKELQEKGTVYRANSFNRFSTKVEVLKNKPKEME